MHPLAAARRGLTELGYRLGGWPRRLLALGCVLLAVTASLSSRDHRATAARADVLVAAHDLTVGRVLVAGDLRVARWAVGDAPPGALRAISAAVGGIAAGAIGAGEALTPARLRGRGLTAGLPAGSVAMTVTLADATAGQLLQAGDVVDLVLRTPGAGASAADASGLNQPGARPLATGVRVLAVIAASERASDGLGPATAALIIAADTATSLQIAAAVGGQILATLRSPP